MKINTGYFYLAGAFFLAGTSVIAARYVSGSLGVFTIAAMSLFFALCGLLPFCLKKFGVSLRSLKPKGCLMLALQAAFGIFLFRMFLLIGLTQTSSLEAGLLTGATPAITVLMARLCLKEAFGKQTLAGILCTTAGILLLQGNLKTGAFSFTHFWGNLFVLCAAACESAFNILSKHYHMKLAKENEKSMNPLAQTFFVSSFAFLFCLVPAAFEQPVQRLAAIGVNAWLSLGWYGLMVTALAFIFWYAGIKRCSAHTAAAFSGFMPFSSFVLSAVLLGESSALMQWAGGLLIITGMIMIGRQNQKKDGLTPALDKIREI